MNRRLRVLALPAAAVAALAAHALPAGAQEGAYVVIVNEANPVSSMPRQQLADIFMKRLVEWPNDGGVAHPVDQPAVAAVRDAFSRGVHGKPAAAVASWWGQQVFSGRATPPPQRPNDRGVLAFVRGDASAVGYVTAGTAPPDVKVLRVTQ
jgi:ABC-type phosphate transport system substrate-binding protein